MNANDVRRAHELLDYLDARAELSQEQENLLRSFLPELPEQKTLKEIQEEVYNAWLNTHDNEWNSEINGGAKDWLNEIGTQLEGIKDAPAAMPALPAGMRIAEHAIYGRVVVSPGVDDDGTCKIFYLSTHAGDGSDSCWASIDSLTFIDAEPVKPTYPEFLDSPEDYKLAPNGTIVVYEKSLPWVKRGGTWLSAIADAKNSSDEMGATPRRALRWGWGK